MKVLRGILAEELDNARHKLKFYQQELVRLPKGSIVSKRIKGRLFHYLAYRSGPRMVFKYQGRLNDKELDKFQAIRKERAQIKGFVAEMKKQIHFIERALRERKRRKTRASSPSRPLRAA